MPTGFGQTRSTSRHGVYRMVFRARDEQVARTALAEGHRLLMSAINDEPFEVAPAVERVREKIDDCYLGPSTASIVGAATDRRIPHIRLNDGNLVQLGYGSAQRRIWTAETDLTSAIAEGIASDKDMTKTLLKSCGVPVPEGAVADSPEAAWDEAEDIGVPVVVKPSDANHGRGVSLDLRTREEVMAAWHIADAEGSEVIVERYIPGDEHRVLVVQIVALGYGMENRPFCRQGHSPGQITDILHLFFGHQASGRTHRNTAPVGHGLNVISADDHIGLADGDIGLLLGLLQRMIQAGRHVVEIGDLPLAHTAGRADALPDDHQLIILKKVPNQNTDL